jgi:hypothetical protein
MSDLAKVFSIRVEAGTQAQAESLVKEFTPKGPAVDHELIAGA